MERAGHLVMRFAHSGLEVCDAVLIKLTGAHLTWELYRL